MISWGTTRLVANGTGTERKDMGKTEKKTQRVSTGPNNCKIELCLAIQVERKKCRKQRPTVVPTSGENSTLYRVLVKQSRTNRRQRQTECNTELHQTYYNVHCRVKQVMMLPHTNKIRQVFYIPVVTGKNITKFQLLSGRAQLQWSCSHYIFVCMTSPRHWQYIRTDRGHR